MKESTSQGNRYLSWGLRILLILMILLFTLFSLDVFEQEGFWKIGFALLMHNIPSFAMIIILIVAWKRENIGGILLMIGIVGFAIFLANRMDGLMWGTIVMLGIPFLIGALFVANHYFFEKKPAVEGD